MDNYSLVALIAGPLAVAVLLALAPVSARTAGYLATLTGLGVLGGTAGLIYRFQTAGGPQFAFNHWWIKDLGIRFHLAVNGLSLAMVAVTALVMACAIGYGAWEGGTRSRASFALLLVLESALILLFCARDLVVFYVGFEAMLIPLYFLIGLWGGEGRRRATIAFVIYTAIGTLLMLVGILALGTSQPGGPNFDMELMHRSGSMWIALAFVLAFAIKSPVFPLHGWLPPAYRAAQPEVAAVLSGVASKAGAYGLLAIVLPLFPEPVADMRLWVILLATFGLLHAALTAFRQPDSRGVIAYSSIAQMCLITVGIFLASDNGVNGAAFQMANHAVISAALFLLAGWIAATTGSDAFEKLGGLAKGRPVLATTVMVIGMIALAVPGSSLFASETLILLGAFQYHMWIGALAAASIVLAAMYMLRWISAVLHGAKGTAAQAAEPRDFGGGAALCVLPLLAVLLFLSFYPNAYTSRVNDASSAFAQAAAKEIAP